MYTPLVSVIVPNYNHAQYLEKRIDTVLNQTYQNIEVIILDDKSKDNSIEVIEKYRNHPKVAQIILNEQNTGSPFKQWDKGISAANGELIWIAESDDYNELTFLEEIIIEWNKHRNVVVAFSNYVVFWGDKFSFNKERPTQCFRGDLYIKKRMSRGNYIMNASGVVFDKQTYLKIDKDYLNFRNTGDYLLWTKMLRYGAVLKVNKNLTYYRRSNTSVTTLCGANGVASFETKKVFDYINTNFRLNCWQRKMAYATILTYIDKTEFQTIEIKNNILNLWEADKYKWKPNNKLLWLIGALERHFGVLL